MIEALDSDSDVIPQVDGPAEETLREGCQKHIESVSMLIPPSDPPSYCERLRQFFFCFIFGIFRLLGV